MTVRSLAAARWDELRFEVRGAAIGSPLLFDAGVFLVVLGVTTRVLFGLLEKEEVRA